MEKLEELEKLAEPLREYLKKNWHPHATIIITTESVTATEDAVGIPFDRDKGK